MLLWRGLWTCQGSCVYIVLDDCADCVEYVVEYSLSVLLWMIVLLLVVVLVVVVLLVVLRLLEVNCNRYCWH